MSCPFRESHCVSVVGFCYSIITRRAMGVTGKEMGCVARVSVSSSVSIGFTAKPWNAVS